MSAATNTSDGHVSADAPVFVVRPATKAKVPPVPWNRTCGEARLESQTNSLNTTRVLARQVEDGAVNKANSNQPFGCSFDQIILVNSIANHDLNGDAACTL